MSEPFQERRRADKAKDLFAGLAFAVASALVLAALVEFVVSCIGWALGDGNWHRPWVDARLKSSLEWMDGAPMLGPASSLLSSPPGWLPGPGAWRDILVLAILLFTPCWWIGARVGPALIARFDEDALRPAAAADLGMRWAGPLGPVQERVWAELESWCCSGMGDGRSPFWRPWVLPDVTERLSVAVMVGENGGGKSHLAEAFSRRLDRNKVLFALAAESSLKAVWLRVSVKWNELWWWRKRRHDQPWDCGYLVEDPAARARLAQFRPRRPTLIIADELRESSLDSALQALAAARVDFRHPVRLLVIDVALPGALAMQFDAISRQWKTPAHDLATVPVIDCSGVRFLTTQLRALVGAQPSLTGGERLHLIGSDREWEPVTEALDEQPILVAEALRWIRASGRRLEDLQSSAALPQLAGTLASQQGSRSTPLIAPDLLGKRRDLLRERVLTDRALHRRAGLRQALGGDEGDVVYHALMVATVAGGGSRERLLALMGLLPHQLSTERLQAAFGQPVTADWVPPIKPSVIADELLRLHFDAPVGAEFSQEGIDRLQTLLRQAWLLNPGGTRNTVARWKLRRQSDAFASAMLNLPNLNDLGAAADTNLRIDLVRAFVELAVLHESSVEEARLAIRGLKPGEWPEALKKLSPVLLRAEASGFHALLLWLDLHSLTFPQAGTLSDAEAGKYAVRLASEATHLLQQCVTVCVSVDKALEHALDEAAFAALPLLARFTPALASNKMLASLVSDMDRRSTTAFELGSDGKADDLRLRIRTSLLVAIARTGTFDADQDGWARCVLAALGKMERGGAMPDLDQFVGRASLAVDSVGLASDSRVSVANAVALWSRCQVDSSQAAKGAEWLANYCSSAYDRADMQKASAEAWGHLSRVMSYTDREATESAVMKVVAIAGRFWDHEGIQFEAALSWLQLTWAKKDTNPQATEQAAQRVAEIASRFTSHDGIQEESARAWRLVSWAYKDTQPEACEQAVAKVAAIADLFALNPCIQSEAAEAWRNLAHAHQNIDPEATENAAKGAALIAERFERHAGIQKDTAEAWVSLAWAHKDKDLLATERAVREVEAITKHFLWSDAIQYVMAAALRLLASSAKETAPHIVEFAALRAAHIAARFERHEGIQIEAARCWRDVAWAYRNTRPQLCEQVVHRVTLLAAGFEWSANMQYEMAQALRNLSWAYRDVGTQVVEQSAHKVAKIAARFPQHEEIQHEAAQTWRNLSWANRMANCLATELAAQKVANIAVRFPQHQGIQHEAAHAWRNLSWANRNTNSLATERAAQKVANIAMRFKQHEGIQFEAAQAWSLVIAAGIKFNQEALIARATIHLDELAGVGQDELLPVEMRQRVYGRVLEERERALVAVQAWRAQRD